MRRELEDDDGGEDGQGDGDAQDHALAAPQLADDLPHVRFHGGVHAEQAAWVARGRIAAVKPGDVLFGFVFLCCHC